MISENLGIYTFFIFQYEKGYCLRPQTSKSFAESPSLGNRLPFFLSQKSTDSNDNFCINDINDLEIPENLKKFRKTVRDLADLAGISYISFSDVFNQLSASTKFRRSKAARTLFKRIAYSMATDAALEFETMIFNQRVSSAWLQGNTYKLQKVMEAISDCFLDAPSSNVKQQCLSLVTPYISFAELQQYLPGISHYYFVQSRVLAKRHGSGSYIMKAATKRMKFEIAKVHSFLSFITSPHISIDMLYGSVNVKSSDGKTEEIPNFIRIMVNERIVE